LKVIIVGAGEVGFHIAKKLSSENKDVVLVEINEERVRRVQQVLDVQVIQGKGSSPSVLRKAGLDSAEIVIAVTDSDETNIVACLIAQTMSTNIIRVARVRDPEYRGASGLIDKSFLHIDLVISPEEEVSKTLSLLADTPGTSDVLEFADGRVKLIGIKVDRGNPMAGKRLMEMSEEEGDKILVAAIYRKENVIVPRGDTRIKEEDTLFLVTLPGSVRKLLKRFGKQDEHTKRVLVSGGARMGECVARRLSSRGIGTKIIERNRQRCEQLAEALDKVVVLHGEGTDQRLLAEEGVRDVDMFISAAEDEEENVLTALLAKRLGAKRVVSLVDTTEYIPLASTIGVDVVLSPMLSAVSTILQFIRQGKVLSVSTLREDLVEAIEFIAMETSEIVGKPLRKLSMPKGALVGSIVREEEVLIPHGDTIILAGDRVILFARPDVIPKMEKAVKVSLEYF
jgi:trk system potassium uptake protein TrkA